MTVPLRAFTLVLVAMVAGCGNFTRHAGVSCTLNSHCTSAICHPVAKVCVDSCKSPSDCQGMQKQCATFTSEGTTTPAFCQCGSSKDCSTDQVCGTEELICLPRCLSDVDCTFRRTCDKTTGACRR